MARHQNQAVKRARERNKKLKAEDKRAKREKKKGLPQDGAEPQHGQALDGPSVEGGPLGQPTPAASGHDPDAARRLKDHPPA